MAGLADRETWATARVIAEMWSCGDDHCDCTMPIVERLSPNRAAGYPWIRRERLWEGTFYSEASTEETLEQWRELLAARERFNAIPWWHASDVPESLREVAPPPRSV